MAHEISRWTTSTEARAKAITELFKKRARKQSFFPATLARKIEEFHAHLDEAVALLEPAERTEFDASIAEKQL